MGTNYFKLITNKQNNKQMAKLIKLSDDMFDGKHPNAINAGFEHEANITELPVIGYPFRFGALTTSPVTDIMHETSLSFQFTTLNSTYKVMTNG